MPFYKKHVEEIGSNISKVHKTTNVMKFADPRMYAFATEHAIPLMHANAYVDIIDQKLRKINRAGEKLFIWMLLCYNQHQKKLQRRKRRRRRRKFHTALHRSLSFLLKLS